MGGESFNTGHANFGNEETVNIDVIIDRFLIRYFKQKRNESGGMAAEDRDDCVDYVKSNVDLIFCSNVQRDYIASRLRKVIEYKKHVQDLLALPRIEQRTDDWYAARNTLITASDFAQALGKGKFGTQKQFLVKKTGYDEEPFNDSIPALQWGILFEQVACDAYSLKNDGVDIHEFGLLKHPSIPHLGASPDGISDMGIMVEIKCPWRRKLVPGEIPQQYYYQMQGQLDVCGLDECDYLECKIVTYDTVDDFSSGFDENADFKGVIVQATYAEMGDGDDQPATTSKRTFYSDKSIWADRDAQLKWAETKVAESRRDRAIHIKTTYWRIETFAVQRVYRDPDFIATIYPQLENVWKQVVAFKTDRGCYDSFIAASAPAPTSGRNKGEKQVISIDTATAASFGRKGSIAAANNRFAGYAFVEES